LAIKNGGCVKLTFTASGTFSNPELSGEGGTWAGGGSTVAVAFTSGPDTGLLFSGLYVSSPAEYKGSFGGPVFPEKGKLVKGSIAGCL
jgi:hypothetical protein